MSTYINFSNGGNDGTLVTLANSGSGAGSTAFTHLIAGGATDPSSGNAAVTYSTTLAGSGLASSIRFNLGTNPVYVRWDDSQSGTRFVLERDFYCPASVTSLYTLCDIRAGGTVMGSLVINTSRSILSTYGTTQIPASAFTLTANTLYRLKVAMTKETSAGASDGIVEVFIYASNGTTLLWSHTANNVSTTSNNATQYRFGDPSAKTSFTYDYLGVTAGGPLATGWVTPYAIPLANPVVTISNRTNPTTVGGSDGTITITWPAIAGADHYEAAIAPGSITSGFTASDTNATSPKTFSGLGAGTYTVAVKAKAS